MVTGSSGLVGSVAVGYFDNLRWEVHGVDNNMRSDFFGSDGDTTWNLNRLKASCKNFTHHTIDIRDRQAILKLCDEITFDLIIHAAAEGRQYRVFGYKGKQVRDNLHAYDVCRAIHEFYMNPSCGEVYNLGGGRENSISVLEAIDRSEQILSKKLDTTYVEDNRIGDHICYISDLTKLKSHFQNWSVTRTLDDIFEEMGEVYYKL